MKKSMVAVPIGVALALCYPPGLNLVHAMLEAPELSPVSTMWR
jgi:hypothetical protein